MKTLSVAIVIGLFGACAVSFSFALQWPTWVMFMAWVAFYVFGKTCQDTLWTFIQIVLGMCMAALIQITAGLLSPAIGAFSFPVSVFVYIGSLAYVAKTKKLNNIHAWFFGLIILFGVHPSLEPLPVLRLLAPIVAGFVFACMKSIAVETIISDETQE